MTRDPAYRAALTTQVRHLLHDADSPVLALLNLDAVRGLLLNSGAAGRFPREGLELVLDLDAWLRLHRPRLAL
jgi:asparagine synthase (glutamine-hydrolysing)